MTAKDAGNDGEGRTNDGEGRWKWRSVGTVERVDDVICYRSWAISAARSAVRHE